MRKQNFKTAESVAIIANMSLAVFIAVFISLGFYLWKQNQATMYALIGFSILSLICNLINIIFAQKLNHLKLEKGKPKNLAELAIKQSCIVIFPILFSITISRFRSSLWESYIYNQTSDVEKESDVLKKNLEILEKLREDRFISRYKYEKLKDTYNENMKKIKKLEDDNLKVES